MPQRFDATVRWLCAAAAAPLVFLAACYSDPIWQRPSGPSRDELLRASFATARVISIAHVPAQNPALVALGRSLFFDKILSGNRDVSCATCHDPLLHAGDGLSLAVGTGATIWGSARTVGPARTFVPRNAPTLLNKGLGFVYLFWDGRVNEGAGAGRFTSPTRVTFPGELSGLLAAQAMLPVLNRAEMRGERGDVDRFGSPNELAQLDDADAPAIWSATMRRLLSIPDYAARFAAAYPNVPSSLLGFQHAANAIAAFETEAFSKVKAPIDRYLAGDDRALSEAAKRGGELFVGRGQCLACHSGPLLGGQEFANVAVPQLGPGVGRAVPLDIGRGEDLTLPPNVNAYRFAFRIAPLRNVELTAPYMHNGAYPTLEAVVRHYSNVDSAQRSYDATQLAPELRGTHHGDQQTINAVLGTLDRRVARQPRLSVSDQRDLVAFLEALTDPSARNMGSIVPASVPSGLSIRY